MPDDMLTNVLPLYQHRTRGGLYVHDPQLMEIANYTEELGKARTTRLLNAAEEQFMQQSGALFSVYNALISNMAQYGAAEKPPGTESHKNLRQYSKQSIVDSLVINARITQIRHLARQVIVEGKQKGFAIRHKRWSDKSFKITPTIKNTIREIEAIVFAPNKEVHPGGFRDVLVKLTQGQLVIDRMCCIVMRDRAGRPLSWHILPPDGIKPRYEVLLKHMPANRIPGMSSNWSLRAYRGAQQQSMMERIRSYSTQDYQSAAASIFAKFGVDVSEAAYIQEVDNIVTGAWREDEIAVEAVAPSDEINLFHYGCSPLERSLEVTSMLIYAVNYNRSLFTKNYPEAMLLLHGNVNTIGLETFKSQIWSEIGPEMGAARLPVLSTGNGQWNKAELLKLRDSIKDMEMPQFIRLFTSFKTSAYRCHPSILNLEPDRGGGQPSLINNTDEAFQIDLSQEEGLGALAESLGDFLTAALLRHYEPWRDYCVVPVLDKILSEQEVIELWNKRLEAGTHTIDEARAAQGDDALEKVSDIKGNYIPNQYYFQAKQAQQQDAEQELQQLLQPEPQGDWTVGNSEQEMTFDQPQQWTLGE